MPQDNSKRKQVLQDLKTVLQAINGIAELSSTLKSPDEVTVTPAVYYVGGSGPRDPKDIQLVHFEHRPTFFVYVYTQKSNDQSAQGLAEDLEDLIKTIVDAIDNGKTVFQSHGYDLYASDISTDEGTLANTGYPMAFGQITLTAELPSADA